MIDLVSFYERFISQLEFQNANLGNHKVNEELQKSFNLFAGKFRLFFYQAILKENYEWY